MANLAEIYKFPCSQEQTKQAEVVTVASLEKGFTRLANTLLDAAISHDMTKRQYKVFLAVIRKTYGFQKKRDRISGSQLSEITNMPRARCSEVLNELIEMKLIIRTGGTQGELEINKKTSEWTEHKPKKCYQNSTSKQPKQYSTETVTLTSTETVTHASTETVHTKESLKDNSKDKELTKVNSCSEQGSEPAVAWIPTNKKDERYEITQTQIDEWSETYPAVDVLQQLREMYSWSNANPTRRKTQRGMPRFIVSWLSREQDRPSAPSHFSQHKSNNVGDQLAAMQAAVAHMPALHDDEVIG
jgi:phage replication O-like protein O